MKFEIKNLPPLPRNRSHQVVRNMLIKTDLARAFEADLTERLGEFSEDFRHFAGMVRLDEHYFSVVYDIYTPSSALFTKDGRISSRCPDLDSYKVFQDTIFRSLGFDDKMVREVSYITHLSHNDKWNYAVSIAVKNIKELKQLENEDEQLL